LIFKIVVTEMLHPFFVLPGMSSYEKNI